MLFIVLERVLLFDVIGCGLFFRGGVFVRVGVRDENGWVCKKDSGWVVYVFLGVYVEIFVRLLVVSRGVGVMWC